MNGKERDLYIIKKIIQYCAEADETVRRFGDSIDFLKTDNIFKNAAAMCILQIGELVGHLTDGIKNIYTGIPWTQIKGMRNIAAHGYEEFDIDILWQTIKVDLPLLRSYCEFIIESET